MDLDWAEKYRPKSLSQVMGNSKALKELQTWASRWEEGRPDKKAVILAGGPGVGKTSAALALASDFGWGLIELNASDARNAPIIKQIVGEGGQNETFTSDGSFLQSSKQGRKLIVIDEADNLFESVVRGQSKRSTPGEDVKDISDRGGKRAIVDAVSKTKQPIILIVNDLYGLTKGSGQVLNTLCRTIKFTKVYTSTIKSTLTKICKNEGLHVSPDVLEALASRSGGDLRSAINDLQSLGEARGPISISDVDSMGYRDPRPTIFSALATIFKTQKCTSAQKVIRGLDESPEHLILWIDENLPLEYQSPSDLVRGYYALSRSDVMIGRIRRRQSWNLLSYAGDLMSCGVAMAKERPYHGYHKYRFPLWLSKMSRSKDIRSRLSSLTLKIGRGCHTSKATARMEYLDLLQSLFPSDREFALHQIAGLDLYEDEVTLLCNEKRSNKNINSGRAHLR